MTEEQILVDEKLHFILVLFNYANKLLDSTSVERWRKVISPQKNTVKICHFMINRNIEIIFILL